MSQNRFAGSRLFFSVERLKNNKTQKVCAQDNLLRKRVSLQALDWHREFYEKIIAYFRFQNFARHDAFGGAFKKCFLIKQLTIIVKNNFWPFLCRMILYRRLRPIGRLRVNAWGLQHALILDIKKFNLIRINLKVWNQQPSISKDKLINVFS